jgi:hypothetical protein
MARPETPRPEGARPGSAEPVSAVGWFSLIPRLVPDYATASWY